MPLSGKKTPWEKYFKVREKGRKKSCFVVKVSEEGILFILSMPWGFVKAKRG